uniref:Glutathione peroxidase n=1 Tax=Chaetoceros debilis TaxID=122233 RepID=A0A7S3V5C0_9STRA|eukprot:CAMPEP_0194116342 /NCGR_PEP_ID=MMETSP0150-20130528/26725_1 /TAXON_ID=122233 /ORGANISM="Chaetoceros debilis, Strain MM31A-1" /LENGTH=235 /DNA_ID=CAMNT_0038807039 /DNA_START=11 /DNA_END=718 /DNA_ORIENTATION=+
MMMKQNMLLRAILLVSLALLASVSAQKKDTDKRCREWAEMGECDNNPGYMRSGCQASCEYVDKKKGVENDSDIAGVRSFFELSANDIDGGKFEFNHLYGKVTVVVNVASYCGYTENHYRGLNDLWDAFRGTGDLEIMAFPSNQFGAQEPDSCAQIKRFALEQKKVDFRMMYKIDVNGPDAHPAYKYLKAQAGPMQIGWNFATYFVISPEGQVRSYSGVEPMELKDLISGIIEKEL